MRGNLKDIKAIMEIIEDGRALLKTQGNGQWQYGYPNEQSIRNDITNDNGYIIRDGEIIVAYFAATYYEEAYNQLIEGSWLTNLPYMVMHRCAVRKSYHGCGIGKMLFKAFEDIALSRNYKSLRIDTHAGNKPMFHLLKKCGYIECGRAILPPDKDRQVFEKVLEDK